MNEKSADHRPLRVLLTGASGYIGGRLLPLLRTRGLNVRCLSRRPDDLQHLAGDGVEVVYGDLLERDSLLAAMESVDVAYYLVHSMGADGDFEAYDRLAAQNFADAAAACGVRRIIYLGGLGNDSTALSAHLRSRREVGELLRAGGVPVIEFRASIIIGSGSLSFEMVRALVERLPVMVTPRWVDVKAQPISVGDVLSYLLAALDLTGTEGRIYEIGGADVVSYGEIMREYARQRGLRRLMIRVPVLTPYLSSLWLGLVTPIYARVGRKLIDSIRHPTVVGDRRARSDFAIEPMGLAASIAAALNKEDRDLAQTRWSDAVSASGHPRTWGGVRFGNRLVDSREARVAVVPDVAFGAVSAIGGNTGWYFANWLWRLRGWMDLLCGGVGMRRGRRHPAELRRGDVLDCWRVEEITTPSRLLLRAEMKVPGRAWLEFEVEPDAAGSIIRQTAIFDPQGIAGLAYWFGIYPLHELVFRGMIAGVARAAERRRQDGG